MRSREYNLDKELSPGNPVVVPVPVGHDNYYSLTKPGQTNSWSSHVHS